MLSDSELKAVDAMCDAVEAKAVQRERARILAVIVAMRTTGGPSKREVLDELIGRLQA